MPEVGQRPGLFRSSPCSARRCRAGWARRWSVLVPTLVWSLARARAALALQLLDALGDRVQRYTIVDLSGSLRAPRASWWPAHKLRWVDALPESSAVWWWAMMLDAMPVQLLARHGGQQGGVA